MAAGTFIPGLKVVLDAYFTTATLKIMLVKSSYTFDPDHQYIGSVCGPGAHECNATNYAGGFAGGGRKTATATVNADTTDDRIEITFTNLTWTTLGGAVNNTIGGAVLVEEKTSDADSPVLFFLDLTNFTTNGTDVTLTFSGDGNIQFEDLGTLLGTL